MFKKIRTENKEKGFTLLEVTFVIAIFAVMASIVLFRFRDFGTQASLNNLAQDVALRIVEAQKAAISGMLNPSSLGLTPPTYGVYFESGVDTDTTNHQFTYFTDIPATGFTIGNKQYDSTGGCGSGECISQTTITTGEYVSDICYKNATTGPVATCSSTGSAHVSFTRPFPDATTKICPTTGACISPADAQTTYIEITSGIDSLLKRTIVVSSLGETRVFNGSACEASGGTGC